MGLYLGVDGGGTGCRAALAGADGHIIGRGEAASANIWTDPEGSLGNILAAARAAMAEARLEADLSALTAVLGLAGANVPEAAARLAGRLPFARARIESDALVALKGALGEADGITAALGTGSVFGVQRRGVARMIGGWGFLLGDQGSGARIGRALYEAALLAHDGLAEATPLLRAMLAETGGAEGIVAFGQRAAPADFARQVPRVLAAAAAGDPAGAAILAEAEAAVARAIDRLQADGPLPVCFLGGLGPVFAARLAGRYPGLIRAPLGSALDGALAMARGARMSLFSPEAFAADGGGPLYLQLNRRIAAAIEAGVLTPGQSLPPEREMAQLTGLSRVTVRKAVQSLVQARYLVQRRGSGTFVAPRIEKVEQALSLLTSFSEDMARRGKAVRSVWLARTLQAPSPEEMMALGLTAHDQVARLERVRLADEVPLAIERAALPTAILPDPAAIGASLYAALAERGLRPVRAVQRISAANLGPRDAGLLEVPVGAAGLRIERVSYLPGGRVVEFTRSLYRGDAYDFAAELKIPADDLAAGPRVATDAEGAPEDA